MLFLLLEDAEKLKEKQLDMLISKKPQSLKLKTGQN